MIRDIIGPAAAFVEAAQRMEEALFDPQQAHRTLGEFQTEVNQHLNCLLYTSPSPRDS